MAKYVINENSDLHSLAREVAEIASRRETAEQTEAKAVHEVTTEAPVKHREAARGTASNRPLLFGIGLGAAAMLIAIGAFFGIGRLLAPGMHTIPNVVNQRADAARSQLEACGFLVKIEYDNTGGRPAGTVIAQVPPARVKKPAGAEVLVRVAGNPPAHGKPVSTKTGVFELGRPGPTKPTATGKPGTPPTADASLTVTPKPSGAASPEKVADTPKDTTPPESVKKTLAVPAVEGMTAEAARQLLQNMGLKVVEDSAHVLGTQNGVVVSIDPKAGADIPVGALVRIRINTLSDDTAKPENERSGAPNPEMVVLRDYTGMSGEDAAKDLYSRGLKAEWQYEASTQYSQDRVIITTPPAGSRIPPGSKVFMMLSR